MAKVMISISEDGDTQVLTMVLPDLPANSPPTMAFELHARDCLIIEAAMRGARPTASVRISSLTL